MIHFGYLVVTECYKIPRSPRKEMKQQNYKTVIQKITVYYFKKKQVEKKFVQKYKMANFLNALVV